MPTETQHFGLTKLNPGEGVHAGSGRFPAADRDTIDQLLYQMATHHHTGEAFVDNSPDVALDLTLSTTGGTLPAGTTIRYVYTYTDPTTGETTASPVASVTTIAPITSPAAPTASLQTIGGELPPGSYYYVLSAYQGATTVETKAVNPLQVTVPQGTSTNVVNLTLPALPAGATGFNVYRRTPGGTAYHHLGFTTASSFSDTGEGAVDPATYLDPSTFITTEAGSTTLTFTGSLRTLPAANTTNSTNSVTVDHPSTVPAGNTWTIYRSYTTSFDNTRLVDLLDTDLDYTDTGEGVSPGSPPTVAATGAPSKVDLEAEVQGTLPVANGGTGGVDAATARTNLGAADDTVVVKLTGDQTVAGVKTFSTSPVVPTPATASQAATKAYVDAVHRGYYDVITHGATASTVRTAGIATDGTEPILWRGSVEPTNAVNGDDWLVTV